MASSFWEAGNARVIQWAAEVPKEVEFFRCRKLNFQQEWIYGISYVIPWCYFIIYIIIVCLLFFGVFCCFFFILISIISFIFYFRILLV